MLGAVAYDPKVVTIWEGFRAWFRDHGLDLDYVLFSNYEAQVDAHLGGAVDVAWNSPLAWVRTRRAAAAREVEAVAVAMRDTDRDLRSLVVVRAGDGVESAADLRGRTVAVGAVDSPQATLLPLSHLRTLGLHPGTDVTVRRFDVLCGKHGDHIGGERDAARALAAGEVDAACLLDASFALVAKEGVLAPGAARVLTSTPAFDHCNMTALNGVRDAEVDQLRELLLGMRYDDDEVRPLLDLEGLRQWLPGRTAGYAPLERAVDEAGFYDARGNITAADFRY